MLERESVMTCLPSRPRVGGGARRGRAHVVGQAGEIALAVEHQAQGLLVGQHVLAEVRGERREPLVDLGDARSSPCGRAWRRRARSRYGALQDAPLLVGEAQAIAALIEVLHAREDLGVEHHRRLVRGELRRDLALDGLQLLVVCAPVRL